MTTSEWIMVLFQVLGGLSLFIYGMHVMTGSVREVAGSSLRKILSRATKSPIHGLTLGVAVGFLAHSAAAVTMIASFINAGVMTLAQSIAPVFGANIGTSLSMQLVSFNIGAYCWAVIGIGFLVEALVPSPRWRKLGNAMIGFGLLFLGMETISAGIKPHADVFAPWLAKLQGDGIGIRLFAVGVSTLLTAILTSSGAMIGVCFGLVGAGVYTELEQVAPIVLGAHIGTCIVPVLASLSMRIGARRAAWAHVLFNVLNVAIALAMWPALMWLCKATAGDGNLMRQVANLHTFAMTIGALAILPFTRWFSLLLLKLTPSKEAEPTPSFLEDKLLDTPEQAIVASIRELRRMADLCSDNMMINGQLILAPTPALSKALAGNEEVLNEIKTSMTDYLRRLASRKISGRQTLFLQYLARCAKDIERIGDHIAHLAAISVERFSVPDALVPEALFHSWFKLFCMAKRVLALMARSFDPDNLVFQANADEILRARDAYVAQSNAVKAAFTDAIRKRQVTAVAGYYLSRHIENLDRLVRRAKSIAIAERQPDFWIKPDRMERTAEALPPEPTPHSLADVRTYLDLLRRDALDDPAESDAAEADAAADASLPPPPAKD